ncbi:MULTISPECIES: DUF1638 domain-containing protein [Anaerotruncus]|uniref:DUF1638 domain-containing protein n=1 Tax=Anaerotruncus TaxID=244127 RepID=UPI001314095E|nr:MULTISPECIES: DUF1638 domain-containing protein [Anaerotruncus]
MRIHIIACQVFSRELRHFAAVSPHIIDITWLPQGLHDTPTILRSRLESAVLQIEDTPRNRPDFILFGYGLCSNGTMGVAARTIPIVIPRTDDCIGIFLGSQARYLALFNRYQTAYWLNNGWIENAFLPTPEALAEKKAEYTRLYGEDNAEYLAGEDVSWTKNYRYCGFIHSTVYHNDSYRALADRLCGLYGWEAVDLRGDCRMLEAMVGGQWDPQDFLVCPPGTWAQPSYDRQKMIAVPAKEEAANG